MKPDLMFENPDVFTACKYTRRQLAHPHTHTYACPHILCYPYRFCKGCYVLTSSPFTIRGFPSLHSTSPTPPCTSFLLSLPCACLVFQRDRAPAMMLACVFIPTVFVVVFARVSRCLLSLSLCCLLFCFILCFLYMSWWWGAVLACVYLHVHVLVGACTTCFIVVCSNVYVCVCVLKHIFASEYLGACLSAHTKKIHIYIYPYSGSDEFHT